MLANGLSSFFSASSGPTFITAHTHTQRISESNFVAEMQMRFLLWGMLSLRLLFFHFSSWEITAFHRAHWTSVPHLSLSLSHLTHTRISLDSTKKGWSNAKKIIKNGRLCSISLGKREECDENVVVWMRIIASWCLVCATVWVQFFRINVKSIGISPVMMLDIAASPFESNKANNLDPLPWPLFDLMPRSLSRQRDRNMK